MAELQQNTNVVLLAFDPYKIKYLEPELDAIGVAIPLVPHAQGFRRSAEADSQGDKYELWMPRSIEILESLIEKKRIRIQSNPCLRYNAASAVLWADARENKIFSKRNSRGRIDGVVALAMAVGAACTDPPQEPRSFWELPTEPGERFSTRSSGRHLREISNERKHGLPNGTRGMVSRRFRELGKVDSGHDGTFAFGLGAVFLSR